MCNKELSKLIMKWSIATIVVICVTQMVTTHIDYLFLPEVGKGDGSIDVASHLGNDNFPSIIIATMMIFGCIRDISLKLFELINQKRENV